MWIKIVSISGILSVLLIFINFGSTVYDFLKKILNKNKKEKFLCLKIIEWFDFIDQNLLPSGLNIAKLNFIEKGIEELLYQKKYSKLEFSFNNNFIRKYLRSEGISKKSSKILFIKYSNLISEQLSNVLEKSKTHQPLKISYSMFWLIISQSFHVFYNEYINPDFTNNNYTIDFSTTEKLISLLKIKYKLI
jgi:hypothetical protein